MRRYRATWLVAAREVREAFRRKGTWIVIAVFFFGSTAVMVLPAVLGNDERTTYDVALVGSAAGVEASLEALQAELDAEIQVARVGGADTARRQVEAEDTDLGIVPAVAAADSPSVIVRSGENEQLVGAARQALARAALADRLGDSGLSDTQVTDALQAPSVRLEQLDQGSNERRIASFVITLVLYLLLFSLMMQVANGVAIEKASRISEVLLAVVRPGALLYGKVLGVALTGVIGLAVGSVPVLVKQLSGGDLPEGLGGALLAGAAWFGLGVVLYLSLAGSLAALVERPEEAGSVLSPLMGALIGTFIVAQSGVDTPLGTVLAYVPLTSPVMEPARIATGVSSPAEIAVSLVVLAVSVVAVVRFGSVIYSRAVVRTGRRLKLREVLAAG